MPTIEVAAQGAFPEKLVEFMLFNTLLQHCMIKFEHHLLVKAYVFTHDFVKREFYGIGTP